MPLEANQLKKLQGAGYKVIGPSKHSAVKLCLYTKESIKTGEKKNCYKQRFYGIRSHRCLQMTPSLTVCNLRCSYCWRDFRYFRDKEKDLVDDPKVLVEEAIKAQLSLLSGLGGVEHSAKHLKEAKEPAQVAISLDGEPTSYIHLGKMIEDFHSRGFTTFLVTNGTKPDILNKLNPLPTQLYTSLSAFSEEMFLLTQHPTEGKQLWQNILSTLELLPKLGCRKVIRLTMVKGLNMEKPEEYAKLILKAKPQFIEVKGWSAVGQSRQRMPTSRMPIHEEIREFSKELVKFLPGYFYADEQPDSRVALIKVEGKIPGLYEKFS